MDKKYRILLIDERKITEDGFFKECQGTSKRAYKMLKENLSKAIKCLVYAEIRCDIECKALIDIMSQEYVKSNKLYKDIELEYNKQACDLGVNIDLLKTMVKIKIWAEHASDNEKIIASRLYENIKDKDIVDNLYNKEKALYEINKRLDGWEDLRIEKEIQKAQLISVIEKFNSSFGFNEVYIKDVYKDKMTQRIKTFYFDIQSCYDGKSIYQYEKILEALQKLDFKEEYLNTTAMKVQRNVKYCIDIEGVREGILSDIKYYSEKEVFEESDKNDFLIEKENFKSFATKMSIMLNEVKNTYKQYVKKAYWDDYDNFENEVKRFEWVYRNCDITDVKSHYDELVELFKEIDFNKIIELQKKLDYIVRKNENDEKEICITNSNETATYEKHKKAYKIVWSEILYEIRRSIEEKNSCLFEGISELCKNNLKDDMLEKALDDLEDKIQMQQGGNRFYRSTKDRNVMIMTYEFSGTDDEKYKTGAVVFDYKNYRKVINESKKNTWSGKSDRNKENINGKAYQFYQGRYLFTANNTESFICKLFSDKNTMEQSGATYLKRMSDRYRRTGDLFDYREKYIQKNSQQNYDEKEYGKAGYICSETVKRLVENNWERNGNKKEEATILYMDDPVILSVYLGIRINEKDEKSV